MTTHDQDGYAICDGVFSRRETAALVADLAGAQISRTRAGARHVLTVPFVRRLAGDRRLMGIAARFVGPAPVPFRATLFEKSFASNWLVVWHQDTTLPLCARIADSEWGPWTSKGGVLYAHAPAWALDTVVALRVHLDDSTCENGPLRVLPGTHRLGVLSDDRLAQLAHQRAAVDCVAPAGGVVAMRPLTVHASSKSTVPDPRRVLHIEYAARVNLGGAFELAVG